MSITRQEMLEILLEVAEAIKPKQFDMEYYGLAEKDAVNESSSVKPPCGSVMCLASHAIYHPNVELTPVWESGWEFASLLARDKDGKFRLCSTALREFGNLTYEDSDFLFTTYFGKNKKVLIRRIKWLLAGNRVQSYYVVYRDRWKNESGGYSFDDAYTPDAS